MAMKVFYSFQFERVSHFKCGMEKNDEHIYKLYTKYYKSVILSMATVRNFDIIYEKFNTEYM
jgi:hypothetical protein